MRGGSVRRGARNLWRNPFRSALVVALLGVIVGLTVSLEAITRAAARRLGDMDARLGTLIEVRPKGSFGDAGTGDRPIPFAFWQRVRQIPGVLRAEGYLQRRLLPEAGSGFGFVIGVEPGDPLRPVGEREPVALAEGRPFVPGDETRPVAIVGAAYAEREGIRPERLADRPEIALGGANLEVIGIYRTGNRLADSQVFIPASIFRARFDSSGISQGFVRVSSVERSEDVGAQLRALLAGQADVLVNSEQIAATRGSLRSLRLATAGGALFLLVVGGGLIIFAMLLAFRERSREVGVLKALGASRSEVVLQFTAESALLAFLGGACGWAMASALPRVFQFTLTNMELNLIPGGGGAGRLLAAGGLSLLLAVVGAIYPVARALALPPAQAMRKG